MNAASYVAEAGRGKLVKQNFEMSTLGFKKQVPPFRIAIDVANRNAAVGMTDIWE
jgi:hypothetical protein